MFQAFNSENSPTTLGDKINELYELRERKRELNKELQEINELFAQLEGEVLAEMDEQGIQLTRGSRASVSVSEQVVPTVEDWDAFYEYVERNQALYLLERRVAAAAWREEMTATGEPIPGTAPFTRRSLNLRKV